MSLAISKTDKETADALWILLKPLKKEVRRLLVARLDESLTEADHDSGKSIDMAEARSFIGTLTAQGGLKVPSDERGIYALIDEKY